MSPKKPETKEKKFVAVRRNLHDQDGHSAGGGEHGGTEMGWLVSYADMMTLLFGLFVLLFSLATDKTKDYDKTLEGISDSFFTSKDKDTSIKQTVIEHIKASEIEPKQVVQKIPDIKPEENSTTVVLNDKIEPKQVDVNQDKRVPANADMVDKKLFDGVEKKNTVLNNEKQKIIQELKDTNSKLAESKKQIEDQNSEIENLKKTIEDNQKITNLNFLMVMIRWDMPQQDLDLEIIDGQRQKFNFKNRSYPNQPGHFDIDSQFGPGIEVWKAENYKPGLYSVRTSLFNKNGNNAPTLFKVIIMTQSKSFQTQNVEIGDVGQVKELKFKIDKDGNIQVLP